MSENPTDNGDFTFNADQLKAFGRLRFYVNAYGLISLAGGLTVLIVAAGRDATPAFAHGILGIVLGVLSIQAAGCFAKLEDASNQQINLLMKAIRTLATVYSIQIWAIGIVFLMLIIQALAIRSQF